MSQINFLAGGDYKRQQAARIAACYGVTGGQSIQKSENNNIQKGGKGSGRRKHSVTVTKENSMSGEAPGEYHYNARSQYEAEGMHMKKYGKEGAGKGVTAESHNANFKKSEDEDDHETEGFQEMEDQGLVSDNDADNKKEEVKKSLTPHEHQAIQKARIASCFSVLENDIQKGGEGSKGGHVIGHTKSGKPVYDASEGKHESYVRNKHSWTKDKESAKKAHQEHKSKFAEMHKDFTAEDHMDAAKIHRKLASESGKRWKEAGKKDSPSGLHKEGYEKNWEKEAHGNMVNDHVFAAMQKENK